MSPCFTDRLLPVSGPDNLRLFIGRGPSTQMMEGMPLLHLKAQLEEADRPGWVEWFEKFGQRRSGHDRGVRYQHIGLALEAVRRGVGFLVCAFSLVQRDLEGGLIFNLFPMAQHLVAPHPYRLKLRQDAERRPQVKRFLSWLRNEAAETRRQIDEVIP